MNDPELAERTIRVKKKVDVKSIWRHEYGVMGHCLLNYVTFMAVFARDKSRTLKTQGYNRSELFGEFPNQDGYRLNRWLSRCS